MHEIKSRYQQVDQTRCRIGPIAFFSAAHKKDREWHVLGSVQKLLAQAGLAAPIHADESEAPDFITYAHDGRFWASVKIVEVLRPDEKRHDSYRKAALPDSPLFKTIPPPLENPWLPLRNQIHFKANKRYPKNTILVVYYDIGRFSFKDWCTPFNEQLLGEHTRSAFLHVVNFARVLVLSSDMQCLVELHPTPHTVVADRQF